jgi:hypothetical protein
MSVKVLLDQINVQSPCTASWDAMTGNDQIRFCHHCSLSVHNLSEMTSRQVFKLIAKSNGRLCIRYMRRPDGSLDTSKSLRSSAVKLHRISRRVSQVAAGAFTATLSVTGAMAQSSQCSGPSCNDSGVSEINNRWKPRASVNGRVTAANGEPIPAASVALFNEQTQSALYTSTSATGEFRFEELDASTYKVRFEAQGFSPREVLGVYLSEGAASRIDQMLPAESLKAEEAEEEGEERRQIFVGGAIAVVAPKDPFIRAVQQDDLERVTALIAGRDVNRRDEASGTTALEHAVRNANREMVQLLITAGAKVNAQNTAGDTVLMMMDTDATSDLVWDLINAGAKVDAQDKEGNTALMEAAGYNNQELLKTLLEAGAKVNAKNKQGQTALILAAAEGLVNNLRILINAGAEVNALDQEGKNALFYASDNTRSAAVRLLKANGGDEAVAARIEEK